MYMVYIFPVAVLCFLFILGYKWCRSIAQEPERIELNASITDPQGEDMPQKKAKRERFSFKAEVHGVSKRDRVIILIISAVYALVAFVNLGNTQSVESYCAFTDYGSYADIDLGAEYEIGHLQYFAMIHTGNYFIQFSDDGVDFRDVGTSEQTYADILKWREFSPDPESTVDMSARYIRIITDDKLYMGELAIYDTEGNMLSADTMSFDAGVAPLFDEQHLVPEGYTYMNSSYFDEVYHPRTAIEHMLNEDPYEISHPPLGKIIISIGMQLFGITPFGWRFMGTLFGVLMLPIMFVIIKRMFGRTDIATCATVVFATDFMHFAQTRIATIDTYSVIFILLMYYFMWLYVARGKKLDLALSGIFFGIGAASKWTCFYAGAGLAVIWALHWFTRRSEADFFKKFFKNCAFCVGFFVAVPAFIYYLSYIPYGTAAGLGGFGMIFSGEYASIVWDNQLYMFGYHSDLVSEHPYASRWYQWIVNGFPILYYLDHFDGGTKSTIAAFLNPLLCWGGLIAVFTTIYLAIKKRSSYAVFLLIGYFAQLLPWVFITRLTFEYHYFPSSVFLLMMIFLMFREMRVAEDPSQRRWMYGFTIASAVVFIMFYPVLSGMEVSDWYSMHFLKWLPSWPI